jgi:hypothetical protein
LRRGGAGRTLWVMSTRSTSRKLAGFGAAALLALLLSEAAFGQASGAKAPELLPPTLSPPKEDMSLSFGPMLAAVLVGGAAVGAAFIPVKRGKND